ncbi:hypothetical protein KIN20_020128 [Parelaphostrongylus tenuis]|uniref:Uncharacterized protein n=1 Tax=Parelaphostrongylus tenuis TaxID=148309 RepID=A0AAD5QVE5_PARTN|nr:hypothetical protein KIN20_020128 [Parelaphostrongylus tenuis]
MTVAAERLRLSSKYYKGTKDIFVALASTLKAAETGVIVEASRSYGVVTSAKGIFCGHPDFNLDRRFYDAGIMGLPLFSEFFIVGVCEKRLFLLWI